MPGTLNCKLYVCTDCDKVLNESIEDCWSDPDTADHLGLCCECFSESLGSFKIKLDRPTQIDMSLYEEDNN